MNPRENPFQMLADRAKRGDLAARALLHKRLEPQLAFMVRRTLAQGSARTSMEQTIFAAARRMGLENQPAAAPDREFILSVARSVCTLVVDGIHPGANAACIAGDTIRDF